MTESMDAVKSGVVGIVIGAGTAFVTDVIFGQVNKALAGTVNPGGNMARSVFAVVAGGGFAALMIYQGDRVLQQIGLRDPMAGILYYNVAIITSSTAMGAAKGMRTALSSALNGLDGSTPPSKPPMPQSAAAMSFASSAQNPDSLGGWVQNQKTKSCGASCGNLNLR
jgi:hypothetical protein